MKPEGVDAYPLHWPAGWPRAKTPQTSRFGGSFAKVRDELIAEVDRLGGRHIVLSTNIPLRRDGLPYANQKEPPDSGVAIYFERRMRSMVFACDRWETVTENMRAIQKTIDAIRGIERWGASEMMERAFQAFEALPPPSFDDEGWWTVLGVPRSSTREQIEQRYRDLAKKHHPDYGGAPSEMSKINEARQQGLAAVQ